MQGEYSAMPWSENASIYSDETCWLSVRLASSHNQGFDVIGGGNLGASDSRCKN